MTIFLFVSVVFLWGLTWFAIHLQVGGAPVDVAIFWRFALAAATLGTGLALTGRLRAPPRAILPWLIALGACLFSCNFLAIYGAETYLPSGIVSVVFSMATVLNALNQWLFFRQRPDARILAGGIIGVAGVALMLGIPATHTGDGAPAAWPGLLLALIGTTLFSCGNMISRRLARFQLGLVNTVFYGMTAGALLMAVVVRALGHTFTPPLTGAWLGGLLYLSLFGSVAGFLVYLDLMRRIGADRAAYTTILSPVIALAVSAVFEGAVWSTGMMAGLGLILLGNAIAFIRRRPTPQPAEVEQG
ncbi:DMT family transporter [Ameyamaea chiangmaiensis]|uniref:DMT family transporter n=2 Tax=Ameyamaea chiangmaiensis TaxID=442969 RepID=A0A850PFN2_9PROT|nr:DMT family transporter [Ameyamaea chiangmaiensis]MBS4076639.1 DMT family transporter [Ameyamaea chiangmaiensis]NVN41643.1 DMT family transporter [Ameyamaea chiangmaiensis]